MAVTRITVETETLTIIRRATTAMGWCPDCRAEVQLIALDNEWPADPATATQLQHWLRTGKLHLWQTANGPAQLCIQSLLQCFEWQEARGSNGNAPDQSRRQQQ